MQGRHRVSRSAGAVVAVVAVCGLAVLLGYAMGNYAITAVTTARRKPASAPATSPLPVSPSPPEKARQPQVAPPPPAAAPAASERDLLTELEDQQTASTKAGPAIPATPPPSGKSPATSSARPTTELYRVQVGPYATRQEAVAAAGQLLTEGYQTYVTPTRPFRVQVGAFSRRDAAERLAAELAAKKHANVRVSP